MPLNKRSFTLPALSHPGSHALAHVVAVIVITIGAVIRLLSLDDFSLTLDETTLVQFALGVLERGYPHIYVGTMEVPLATYELVPYPMALSIYFLGVNDFAARLPAALFGIGTSILIYLTALRWFNWRVAIVAVTLYALSPWAIFWGSNCFHPAQAQFFALLAIIQIRTLLSADEKPLRTYYLAVLAFVAAFLSWEGIGFLLPVMFVVGIIVNWGQWRWILNRHLWLAMLLIAVVVVLQGTRRVLLQEAYLMVGSGKSEVSLPQLVFTMPGYEPWFYINNFFLIESHLVLTLLFVLGFLTLAKNWNMKFVYATVITGVFFMTNFLAFNSAHYVFWLLPIFLIAASAAVVSLSQTLTSHANNAGLSSARPVSAFISVILISSALIFSNSYVVKPYELFDTWQDPERVDVRRGLAGVDYRGLVYAFKREYQPGDVVITMASYPMDIYGAGTHGDYFLQSVTAQKVIYDPGNSGPYYVDKYSGIPVLRSQQELEDLLHRHKRVWLLAAPYGIFRIMQNRELLEYINTNMKVRAESYDGILYLWDKS